MVETYPMVDLFGSPNPMMSGSKLIEATFIYLGLTGEACYIAERKTEKEIPRELWSSITAGSKRSWMCNRV